MIFRRRPGRRGAGAGGRHAGVLPRQLTAGELTEAVKAIIAETGAQSVKEMGKVMGVASKRLAGRADGKDISAKVRELLA